MKLFLILCFSLLFALPVFAFDQTYAVRGVTENGSVEGVAYNNDADDSRVYGQLTDEEGNVHSFEGTWSGDGRISGETDDGDAIELSTK